MIQLEFECLQIHRWFFVPIGLSSNLLSILNANLSGAVATRSGWCSVLQLLQSYLDGFPYEFSRAQSTQRHARPERASRTLGPAYAQSDRNRIICADVCSSLRVLFDNVSELYIRSDERKNAVYGRMRFTSNGGAFPLGTLAPDVKSSHNFTSPRLELLPASAAVASPDLPSLCYPAHYLLRLFPTLSKLLGSMSITTCRLAIVTRHVSMLLDYLDLTRSFWFSKTEPPHKESGMHPPASSSSSTFQEKKNTSVTASASESSGSTEPQVQGFRSVRHASQRHANPVLVPRPKVMQAENESTFLEGNEMKAGPIRRSSAHRTLRSSVSEEPDGQPSTFDASVPMGALTRRKETHQKPIEATEDVRSSTRSSRESASRTDLDASIFTRLRCTNWPPIPVFSSRRYVSTTSSRKTTDADIEPPFKKHRDPTSIIRSLMSCVQPCPDAPDFRLGPDPWLGSKFNARSFLLARAKGRLAARMAVRDFFPNDIAALATEVPRINRLLPLLSPDEILKRVTDGTITPSDAMDRLILLLAPRHAWKLYKQIAPDEKWTDETLHRLLDLLSSTNTGTSGNQVSPIEFDLSSLPDPDDMYYMREVSLNVKAPTVSPASTAVFANPTIDADDEAGDAGTVAESSNVADILTEFYSGAWSLHNAAEELFLREKERLQTPNGYCSMIRGASKFHSPARALQFAERAWSTPAGNACLDMSTYSILLRSLCHLDVPNVWTVAEPIINRFVASSQVPDMTFFSSILFALAEFVIRVNKPYASPDQLVLKQCVSVALGLMNEIRSLGLEPSMGVMANLLKVLHFARFSPHRLHSADWRNYSVSYMTESFVSELDRRFTRRPPSRADHWMLDDFHFFTVAMRVASFERNPTLAQRIDQLLIGTEDRRFFLANSHLLRGYVIAYLVLLLHPNENAMKSPLPVVQQLDTLYRRHKDTIVTTPKTMNSLLSVIKNVLRPFIVTKPNNEVIAARCIAYSILCTILLDILEHIRLSEDAARSTYMPVIMQLLADNASLDPRLAAATSGQALTCLKVQAAKISRYRLNPEHPVKSKAEDIAFHENPRLIKHLIRMTFPEATEAMQYVGPSAYQANASQRLDAQKVLTILQDWLAYCVELRLVSWEWTPSVIGFLHQQEVSLEYVSLHMNSYITIFIFVIIIIHVN
ncbi:unnamed protein product [Dicrocoelium dendriticum]|nr:unnamed protein product [Dicrocoelium dendriticum]